MKVSPETIQKIKSNVNIVDLIGEHVVLKKGGANYSGLCPFHSERTPSFSVSEAKQLYHCYGCKMGGDLLSFVMEVNGLSFYEAIEDLASRVGVELPQNRAEASGDPEGARKRAALRSQFETAYKLNRFVSIYFRKNLTRHSAAQSYLKQRRVTPEIEKVFYIGVAGEGWENLAQYLKKSKAPLDIANRLGLIRPGKRSGHFDLFRNRVLFPTLDLRGRVAGFGGRILPSPEVETPNGGSTGESPKYLNSPESFVFQKSKLLFGLQQAKKYIREANGVILVEGYFDVLALWAAGIFNVVATCGTALTSEHLSILRRFGEKVTLLFDGDRAGIQATDRSMVLGLEKGLALYGAQIPDGLDPDEFLAQPDGKQQLQELIQHSKPLIDQRIESAIQAGAQSPEERTQAVKKIAQWLSRFSDPVGREIRREHVKSELRLGPGILESAEKMDLHQKRPLRTQGENSAASKLSNKPSRKTQVQNVPIGRLGSGSIQAHERILLSILSRMGEFLPFWEAAAAKLPSRASLSDLFSYQPAKTFTDWLFKEHPQSGSLEALSKEISNSLDQLVSRVGDLQVRSIITEAALSPTSPCTDDEARRALERGVTRVWAQFSQKVKAALAEAEARQDSDLHGKLLKDYLDVQRKMKEFDSLL